MPFRKSDVPHCPSCGEAALSERRAFGVHSFRCRLCHGHWLSWPEFERQLESQAKSTSRDQLQPVAQEPTRRCPECDQPLTPHRMRGEDPIVDVCAEHGIWFDHHELESVTELAEPRPEPTAPPREDPLAPNVEDAWRWLTNRLSKK